jgi:hypothetical protein
MVGGPSFVHDSLNFGGVVPVAIATGGCSYKNRRADLRIGRNRAGMEPRPTRGLQTSSVAAGCHAAREELVVAPLLDVGMPQSGKKTKRMPQKRGPPPERAAGGCEVRGNRNIF